jgi:hypothetical protein
MPSIRLFLLATLLSTASLHAQSSAPAATVDQLINKNIEAKGGGRCSRRDQDHPV